jgi:hypothetical protein
VLSLVSNILSEKESVREGSLLKIIQKVHRLEKGKMTRVDQILGRQRRENVRAEAQGFEEQAAEGSACACFVNPKTLPILRILPWGAT